ncbi:hypothetical protein FQN50_003521 [Emmonsiellopsis sp. PD_5]|nr:hypothetical protein FQN50_003521 [Emmonsiellopsis sp. PD_5]
MWLQALELWLTVRLLRSPTFHKGVRQVHKKIQEIRYGKLPEDMGGTNIDKPDLGGMKRYLELFREELKNQAKDLQNTPRTPHQNPGHNKPIGNGSGGGIKRFLDLFREELKNQFRDFRNKK